MAHFLSYKKKLYPHVFTVMCTDNGKKKVCILGSGKWGTAVAKLVGQNVKNSDVFHDEIRLYVHEDNDDIGSLADIINEQHINTKHLPGIKLPENIVAFPCPKKVAENADVIIFVQRQQFLAEVCRTLKGVIKDTAIGISLTKSLYHGQEIFNEPNQLLCASDIIKRLLGMDVAVLMGPNLAGEIAKEMISETSIGCSNTTELLLWKQLFCCDYFVVKPCNYVKEVELCGALKNIVAVASGIADGVGCGENSKAAIIRLGFMEMQVLIGMLTTSTHTEVYWEPCGFADVIATCYGGITRRVVELCIKSDKTLRETEEEHFGGMVLEGPENAKQVYMWLQSQQDQKMKQFPLLCAVYKIFHEGEHPNVLIEVLKASF